MLSSCKNTSRQSTKFVPLNGSPPIPKEKEYRIYFSYLENHLLSVDYFILQEEKRKRKIICMDTYVNGYICMDIYEKLYANNKYSKRKIRHNQSLFCNFP